MTTNVRIPKDAARAVDALADIGALVTAKEWHRAAIIAALVGPPLGQGSRSDLATSRQVMTTRELAEKGLVGLTTHDTVERYRDAWCAVREVPALGDTIDLDGLPDWPPTPKVAMHIRGERREALETQAEADGTGKTKVLDIAQNPKAMASAIKADPEIAKAAHLALQNRFNRDHPQHEPSAEG